MKRTLIAAALLTVFSAGPVLAAGCPGQVRDIDAALSGDHYLTTAQVSEVRSLRDAGDGLHKAGKHAESWAALQKAKAIMGIK